MKSLLIDITPLRISPAFRRVFIARAISLLGIGMLLVSVPVQMWELTGSSFQVGAATAVAGVATFAGMLLGGIAADRFDRRTLILTGRSVAAAAFAGLALNSFGVFGGHPQVWILYALAGIDGLIGALSAAALMAAVPTLIPRTQLAAVGALSAMTVRIGTAVSPGLAGLIIAAGGVRWTFTAAAVAATITVLILLGLPPMPPHAALADDQRAGDRPAADPAAEAPSAGTPAPPPLMAFLRSEPVVGSVMAIGLLTMLGTGLVALLPALVAANFGTHQGAVGYLMAASATGALVATVASGWINGVRRPGALLLGGTVAGFALIAALGSVTILWAALALLAVIGFLEATAEVVRYMLIQQHTPGPLLGRVNGIWMAQEVSGVTVGALVAGALGSIWAAPTALTVYGAALAVAGVLAALALVSLRTMVRAEPRETELTSTNLG